MSGKKGCSRKSTKPVELPSSPQTSTQWIGCSEAPVWTVETFNIANRLRVAFPEMDGETVDLLAPFIDALKAIEAEVKVGRIQ